MQQLRPEQAAVVLWHAPRLQNLGPVRVVGRRQQPRQQLWLHQRLICVLGALRPGLEQECSRHTEVGAAVAVGAQRSGQRPLVLAKQRPAADGVPHPSRVAEVPCDTQEMIGRGFARWR